jgi:molybdenum cofactor guanylyltransferase
MSGPDGASQAIVAVLSGGLGSRLGGQKAIARLAGRPLIEYVLAAAHEAELEAVVLAKRDTGLPALSRPPILEPDEPRHPLCGVLAALDHARERSPSTGVVLVGCDMPFLTAGLMRLLAGMAGAAMLEVGGRLQPLPSRCLPEHRPSLQAALAREASLSSALAGLEPEIVGEDAVRAFGAPARLCASINRPDQLAEAERSLLAARGPASS